MAGQSFKILTAARRTGMFAEFLSAGLGASLTASPQYVATGVGVVASAA